MRESVCKKNHVKYHLHILVKPPYGIGLLSFHTIQWQQRGCEHKKSWKRLSIQIIRTKMCHCSVTQWDTLTLSFRCLLLLFFFASCRFAQQAMPIIFLHLHSSRQKFQQMSSSVYSIADEQTIVLETTLCVIDWRSPIWWPEVYSTLIRV